MALSKLDILTRKSHHSMVLAVAMNHTGRSVQ
jgi:hypothetical protein